MSRKCWIPAFLFVCLLLGFGWWGTTAQVKAVSPVKKWGQLSVSGTNIVNQDGKKVQLKGVSTQGMA